MSAVRGRGVIRAVAGVALAVMLAACGDSGGPEGPGSFEGTVRSSTAEVGAVVLELTGPGIQGIEGIAGTRAFESASAAGAATDAHRVVLVSDTPGSMGFRVRVDDLAAGAPRAILVSAVDGENQRITELVSFSVTLER